MLAMIVVRTSVVEIRPLRCSPSVRRERARMNMTTISGGAVRPLRIAA